MDCYDVVGASNNMKTNIGLIEHCEKALKEKWYYLWGSFAQKSTKDLIDRNIKQYPENLRWKDYVYKSIGITRVCDCYGLLKSYLWWTDDDSNPAYNSTQDINTTVARLRASEEGPIRNMPEIPGLVLYMPGHVGIYIGNGRFIECCGGGVGMREGLIKNGEVVKGSKFIVWFKDKYITYLTEEPKKEIDKEEEEEMVVYKTIEEVPEWGRPTVVKAIKNGIWFGNGVDLNMHESTLQALVIQDRLGQLNVYKKIEEIPAWAILDVQEAIKNKIIAVDDNGEFLLNDNNLKSLVYLNRYKLNFS